MPRKARPKRAKQGGKSKAAANSKPPPTPEEVASWNAFADNFCEALNHRNDPLPTVPERERAANAALWAAGHYNGPDGFHDEAAEKAAWLLMPTTEEVLRWEAENGTYPEGRKAAGDLLEEHYETPDKTLLREQRERWKKDERRREEENRRREEAEARGLPRLEDVKAHAADPQAGLDFLSVQEVADVCNKSKGRISQLCSEGRICCLGSGHERKVSLISAQAHFAKAASKRTSKANAIVARDARKDTRDVEEDAKRLGPV